MGGKWLALVGLVFLSCPCHLERELKTRTLLVFLPTALPVAYQPLAVGTARGQAGLGRRAHIRSRSSGISSVHAARGEGLPPLFLGTLFPGCDWESAGSLCFSPREARPLAGMEAKTRPGGPWASALTALGQSRASLWLPVRAVACAARPGGHMSL